jgi:hypothetical protein
MDTYVQYVSVAILVLISKISLPLNRINFFDFCNVSVPFVVILWAHFSRGIGRNQDQPHENNKTLLTKHFRDSCWFWDLKYLLQFVSITLISNFVKKYHAIIFNFTEVYSLLPFNPPARSFATLMIITAATLLDAKTRPYADDRRNNLQLASMLVLCLCALLQNSQLVSSSPVTIGVILTTVGLIYFFVCQLF